MDSWSELHISIVYYSGIFVALLTSVIILLVLSPIESVSKKIFGRLSTVWNKSFKTTLILGGLLGAMSMSFRDCHGNYNDLLASKSATLHKGIEQVATAFDYLSVILAIWLIIFLVALVKNNKPSTQHHL